MSERLLSLEEMARRLNRSAKTFKKYITQYKIPHYQLGSSLLFDPREVLSHLSAEPKEQTKKAPVIRFTRRKTKSGLLSERLGL